MWSKVSFIYFIVICLCASKEKLHSLKSSSRDIFELRMLRKIKNITIKTDQIVQAPRLKCDQYHSGIFHNSTWSTKICFIKDLSFTIEAIIGNHTTKNYDLFKLQIDIDQPWSWVKSKNCHSCEIVDEYNPESLRKADCNGNCKFQSYSALQRYDPFKEKINRGEEKQAAITGIDEGILGSFFYDQLSFLAYNPNKNITFSTLVKEGLTLNKTNSLQDVVTISSLKFLQAQRMINFEDFIGDGSIGLARFDEEYDTSNIQEDTSILKQLLSEDVELEERDLVFGLYINGEGVQNDFALTLGGYNGEYADDFEVEKWFVPMRINKKHSTYQYLIEVKQMKVLGQIYPMTEGYLTVSSRLIFLPYEMLSKLINHWNTQYEMDCNLVDESLVILFCKNVVPRSFDNSLFDFQLNGLIVSVPFQDLLRSCQHFQTSMFNQDISMIVPNQCVFNLAVSPSKRVILGEVFLNKRYTIFDLAKNRIGFLPALTVDFFSDQNEKRELVTLLLRIVTIVFISGIVFLFFFKQIVRKCLLLYISIRKYTQKLNQQPDPEQGQFQEINTFEKVNTSFDNSLKMNETDIHETTQTSFRLNKPIKRKIFDSAANNVPKAPPNQIKSNQNYNNTVINSESKQDPQSFKNEVNTINLLQ